jgi:hypothetical protein
MDRTDVPRFLLLSSDCSTFSSRPDISGNVGRMGSSGCEWWAAARHGPGVFVLCALMPAGALGVCLGVSVEGDDSLVVACVVAAGVGDVGEARVAGRADDEVADGGAGAPT